jgi:hypothetical protein
MIQGMKKVVQGHPSLKRLWIESIQQLEESCFASSVDRCDYRACACLHEASIAMAMVVWQLIAMLERELAFEATMARAPCPGAEWSGGGQ